MQIKYQQLPATDASNFRCSVLMENHMQCPERAAAKLLGENKEKKPIQLCKHHLMVEFVTGSDMGDEYALLDDGGKEVNISNLQTQIQRPHATAKANAADHV